MDVIERTAITLVIVERPWLESLVGGLFIAAGMWPFFSGERLFGAGFMAAGAVLLLVFANLVTVRFDRATNRLTQSKKGLLRRALITYGLDEITGVRVVQGSASGNSPSPRFRLELVLRDGIRLPIGSGYSSGREEKERIAAEIRRFLGLPEVVDQDPSGFGEMLAALRRRS